MVWRIEVDAGLVTAAELEQQWLVLQEAAAAGERGVANFGSMLGHLANVCENVNEKVLIVESFPETLAQANSNRTLLDELRVINERLLVFRKSDFGRPERIYITCHHHLKILARIEDKDMAGACKAMRQNIEDGRNYSLAIKEVLAKTYFMKYS